MWSLWSFQKWTQNLVIFNKALGSSASTAVSTGRCSINIEHYYYYYPSSAFGRHDHSDFQTVVLDKVGSFSQVLRCSPDLGL
jgi:hypothetical protein